MNETDPQQPASTEGEDFVASARRVAAALRKNARATSDATLQRAALDRAGELEKSADRHERVGAALDRVEAKVADADRLRALAEELVAAARKELHALHIEMIPEEAMRQ